MKSVLTLLLAIVLVVLSPNAAARSAPLQEPSPVQLAGTGGAALDTDATRAAIIAGANANPQHWIVVKESPGRIELQTVVRGKHTVVVAADYSAGEVRFDYVSSVEMNHKVRRDGSVWIHPNYMAWRQILEESVRTAAATH